MDCSVATLRSRSRIKFRRKSQPLSHLQAWPERGGTEVCTAKEIHMRRFQTPLNVERLEDRQLLTVYSPAQIRHAYGFDQLSLDGSGQTIAIVDAYDHPNIVDDLKIFDQEYGLPDPAQFTKVNQSGGTTFPKIANAGWSREIALDVEWAHAIAPGANILLVEANSDSPADIYSAVDYARHQAGVVAVSMSLGSYEASYETRNDSFFKTPEGHIGGSGLPGGITFVAATGDKGTPAWYPAYSPNVLAVGGTSLYLDEQGDYQSEDGWSRSGGGISKYESEPAYEASVQSTGKRTIPDVSYNASPDTRFWVYNSVSAGWDEVYGTSAGAPQWAALIALADQERAGAGLGSLDGPAQTLPALYSAEMSGDFLDITTGSNGYDAGPGYDYVTGLGSPWAPSVVSDLALWDSGSNAPRAPVRHSSREMLATTKASPLVSNPLQITREAENAVDACFAEPSFAAATAAQRDLVPMPSAVPGQPARVVSDTGSIPVRHSATPGQGLEFTELDMDPVLSNPHF
jgi:subtilase family serine protease